MYKFFYLDEVYNDIFVAQQWYAEQQNNLDRKFIISIKEALTNIMKMPLSYAVKYRNVRIAHTKTFPYNVHFYIDEIKKQVVIIGIVHNKRNDALFLDR